MFKNLIICFTLLALPMMVTGQALSQEEETEVDFAFGSVVSVETDSISISEYDFETDMDKVVTYAINEETGFEGYTNVADIQVGAEVEILFRMVGDERIATFISESGSQEDLGEESGE